MVRSIVSVVAGYVAWTAVFLSGSASMRALFPSAIDAEGGTDHAGLLLSLLALSVAASAIAGVATARLAPAPVARHVWIVALLLLGTGIPVQIGSWALLPVWYHVLFLAGLVPVTVLAGRWQADRS